MLGIANHSWNHLHDTLEVVHQRHNKKGSFYEISTFDDTEAQIADAQIYINKKTGNKSLLYLPIRMAMHPNI